MKPFRPLYLKTYGKQRRKISAWLSPDDRRLAFNSTASSDEVSEFEPHRTREKYTEASSGRNVRSAKRNAMLQLAKKNDYEDEINEENVSPPSPGPFWQSKNTREKYTETSSGRNVRSATRNAMLQLAKKNDYEDDMSNEENVSPPSLGPFWQSKNTREKYTETSSGRNVRSAKRNAMLQLTKKNDYEDDMSNEENVSPPSLGPFWQSKNTRKSRLLSAPFLRRQRGRSSSVTSESKKKTSARKHLKTSVKMKVNSSGLLASAGRYVTRRKCTASTNPPKARIVTLNSSDDFTPGRIVPSRRLQPSRGRRNQPAFGVSSAESSVIFVGASSFTNAHVREISLNDSGNPNLGPCSRKPIFCSTPSAASFAKRGPSKPFALQGQITSSSVSASCVSNTFQEDLNSPQQPFSPPLSASPSEQDGRLPRNKEQPPDLFIESKGGSCSEGDTNLSGDSKAQYDVELASRDLFSSDSESSSRFVSAAGGLEWLIEALKQKCLSQRCEVQLERLSFLPVTQLCGQTIYSSCLERSNSTDSQQRKELLQDVDSSQSVVCLQSSAESHCFSLTNNESSDYLKSSSSYDLSASVNGLPPDYCKTSAKLSNDKACVQELEGVPSDQSHEISMDTKLRSSIRVQTLFTDQEAKATKDACVSKKCIVPLQKTQLPNPYLKDFAQHREAGAARYERSVAQDPKQHERKGRAASHRKAQVRSVAKSKCAESEKTSEPASPPVKKCRTMKRLRKTLQFKDAHMSEPACDDHTNVGQLSESDNNENSASSKIDTKNGRSTRSKAASGNKVEKLHKPICRVEKSCLGSKENRRGSVFPQQTGTARKACVSGISVSRWKNKGVDGGTLRSRAAKKAAPCELISVQHIQPMDLGTTINFFTPVRAIQLSTLSLLADSPSTHTWSRLKASRSVHRKVQITPKSPFIRCSARSLGLADVSLELFATPLRSMLPRHLRSQLMSQHSVPLCEDADLSDAEKVYAECGQQHPLPWEECILPHRMKRCVKIGEGTFGEVFSTTNSSGDTVALKVIPVEGREKVNGEVQKTLGEILHEIIISKELSSLKEKQQNQAHGFIGLNDLHCVQGSYPAEFLKAWDAFDKRKGSENDRPDFFENDQLFIILEFEFGGVDLENSNGKLASFEVAKSILHQVTAALAVAEQELHFEHRDLHWGNVLVKTTKQKMESFLLNGTAHSVETKGVLVRLIDYSLSRVEIDDLTVSCDISNDEELFMGQGDYQFEIYRLMREENGNNWSTYHPRTNVLWLHYLCSKLLSMKYRSLKRRAFKTVHEELTCFHGDILRCSSATEALQTCSLFQQH